MRSQSKIFARRVEGLMHHPVLCMDVASTCAQVLEAMVDRNEKCAVMVDSHGKLAGILRQSDILKRVAFKVAPHSPVESVMDKNVQTVLIGEYLYHAIARMRRLDVDEIVVVDASTQPVGIVYYRDAVESTASRLMQQIDKLGGEGNLDSLRDIKAAQVEIARDLFEDNVSAQYTQRLLSHVNNDSVARIVQSNLAHLEAEGWGVAPVDFCVIVMGSGGRGENYLYPDQDNGFILDDYADEDHNRIDHFFRELAKRVCDDLNGVGFPYCNGNVMATNPVWRKTLSQWMEQVRLWGRKRNATALRLADIFFDFQPVWGKHELAHDLKRSVLKTISENSFFLQEMYHAQSDRGVALGMFGRFSYEVESDKGNRAIDLKYRGTLPLIEGVRLLALRQGIEETSTLERIEKLHHAGILSDTEADYLESAFSFLTHILLSRQIATFDSAKPVHRHIDVKALSKRERESLQNALRHIEAFRKRLKGEFTGDVF